MSEPATLYGCIVGGGLIGPNSMWFFKYNHAQINLLPTRVDWHQQILVVRNMFTVPLPSWEGFYRHQMIYFGASFNDFDDYWHIWLEQFENLLHKLFWYDAYVHIWIENYGEHSYHWRSDGTPFHLQPPQPVQAWNFTGGPRRFLRP